MRTMAAHWRYVVPPLLRGPQPPPVNPPPKRRDKTKKINLPKKNGEIMHNFCVRPHFGSLCPNPTRAKATAGAALRRLHFRAGRERNSLPGPRSPVPKVIVMGSSTASERTINTSTESANTILTNVTATDGDTTEDSLDHESNHNDHILVSLDSTSSLDQRRLHNNQQQRTNSKSNDTRIIDILDSDLGLPDTPFINERRKSDYVKSNDSKGPYTAPPGYQHDTNTRFPFDECGEHFTESQSAKEPKSVFDSAGSSPNQKNHVTKFIFDVPIPSSPTDDKCQDLLLTSYSVDEKPPKSPKASSSKNETKFTFDGLPLPAVHKNKRNSTDSRSFPKSRNRKSSVETKSMTPPLPDLRVDFFSETIDDQSRNNNDRRPTSCLLTGDDFDVFKQDAEGNRSSSRRPSATNANINVTTNPLDNGSGYPNRKIPQATIVVQQASLSLDYSSVSTILLKDENDFVSNTSPSTTNSGSHHKLSLKKKKQRDEHMKQLLDVNNQLTQQEIHDIEMRYGSPHHSRSQSVKTATRGLLGPPPQRARVASMPSTGVEEQYYRLRHFSITGKGVVNRGDSLKSRRSRSNTSVASSNSSTERLTAPPSLASSRESSASAPPTAPYRVLVLGAPGVGKSSLVSQFMTSEYLHAYDTSIAFHSIDDDSGEKSVSVLLAGEESELIFLDQINGIGPDADVEGPEPHAYCVVYSTSDRGSLRTAEGWLRSLRNKKPSRARILVGNKVDLVRSRAITTEEGKNLAITYDCKFIETSVGINHNVDELLVGLLTQIRLKQEHPERTRYSKASISSNAPCNLTNISIVCIRRRGGSSRGGAVVGATSAQSTPRKQRGARLSASLKVRGLLGRVWARDSKSKSCENLHVL
ncbi:uncharacterized protein LOC143909257 [Arctopsyche grandis]|uniref:uncharacterized protein LOC143909257 n=1 Tax=Arctopsyche grandis TaxID=121162 RepID=UPI00406DA1C8